MFSCCWPVAGIRALFTTFSRPKPLCQSLYWQKAWGTVSAGLRAVSWTAAPWALPWELSPVTLLDTSCTQRKAGLHKGISPIFLQVCTKSCGSKTPYSFHSLIRIHCISKSKWSANAYPFLIWVLEFCIWDC